MIKHVGRHRKTNAERDLTKVCKIGILSKLLVGFLLKMERTKGHTIYFAWLVTDLQKRFRITVLSQLLVMCFLLAKPYMCNPRYFANDSLTIATPLVSGNIMCCYEIICLRICDWSQLFVGLQKSRREYGTLRPQRTWLGNPL